LLSQIARILNGLVILPIALKQYNAEEIAFWLVLASVLGLQIFIDQGLTATLTRYFAYAKVGKNARLSHEIQGSIPSFWQLRLLARYLYMAGASLWFIALLVYGILELPSIAEQPWKWAAWGVFIVVTTLQFFNNQYIVMLEGSGLIGRLRMLDALINFGAVLGVILFSWFFRNIYALIMLQQSFVLLMILKNWLLQRSFLSKLAEQKPDTVVVDKASFKAVFRVSWKSGLGVMLSNGLLNLLTVSVSGLQGDVRVANFLINLRLMQVVVQLSMAPFYSRIPMMSGLFAQGKWDELRLKGSTAMRNAMMLFIGGGGALLLMGEYLIQLFATQMDVTFGWIFIILFFAYYMERSGAMFLQFYSLSNRIMWHIANGITALIFITVFGVLQLFNVDAMHAVIVGFLTGNILFYAPFSFSLLFRDFPISPLPLLKKAHGYTAIAAIMIIFLKIILIAYA
jgi:hypothetical protein